jgi:glycosyltransferase involved in cell wall biosynthesis
MPVPQPPPIEPLDGTQPRPRFSVMLPTYEPDGKLVRAIESVLAQALPPAVMQIAIVDDNSRPGLVRELVESVDTTGRVEIIENDQRLGLCGNWNRAIANARGEFIHLLHQDDYVLPGFYPRIDLGFQQAPTAGMAFCRSRLVDAADRIIRTESRQQWTPGVLANWLPRIAERQRIQTPAVVVARRTYEQLGGYRSDLQLALDWEMWVRIAARFPVWYEPRPLVAYRRHAANETSRLMASGDAWPDIARAIEINAGHLPADIRDRGKAASVHWYAASAMRTAERQIRDGLFTRAAVTLSHIPPILALLDDAPQSIGVARRLSLLREHVSRGLGRRAA